MKNLKDFIIEKSKETVNTCSVTFNFKGLEESKETIEYLMKLGESKGINIINDNNEKLIITLTSYTIEKFDSLMKVLEGYINLCNKSGKRSSSENYAQKLKQFENSLQKLIDFCDNDVDSVDDVDDTVNDEE